MRAKPLQPYIIAITTPHALIAGPAFRLTLRAVPVARLAGVVALHRYTPLFEGSRGA